MGGIIPSRGDKTVATAVVEGTRLVVTGIKEGFSSLHITVGEIEHVVTVTVRGAANNNGWM